METIALYYTDSEMQQLTGRKSQNFHTPPLYLRPPLGATLSKVQIRLGL